ncbi:MAG: HD domain-containing protein [Endomicrobia bacterium]|nr:HD domain-containing protein [Endomicrobiia bacterium]
MSRQEDKSKEIRLDQLVDATQPYAVLEEVKHNFISHYPISEFIQFRYCFNDFIELMEGRFPGYRKYNTKFHDIQHTTDVLLAMSRLLDGYNIKNKKNKMSLQNVKIALVAALFHDTGYLQTVDDNEGTGAKYTLTHVERSIDFISKYMQQKGFSFQEFEVAKNIVLCTKLGLNPSSISFTNNEEKLLGLMLGTADLMGQMSARTYLERLVFLFYEFREAGISGYASEFDLLKKTQEFYKMVLDRINSQLGKVYEFFKYHFRKRYKINKNLYIVAMERAIRYIDTISSPQEMFTKLRRKV